MKITRQMFLSLLVMLTLLFSSFGAINVYADDATPIPEATEEVIVEEGSPESPPETQATEEAAADPTDEADESESAPTEAADPTEETAAPTAEPTEEATGEPTEEAEATEEPTAEPTPMLSDEELDTLPEILENAPEGTEVVILNEDGEPESMASEEAAETLVEGDPIWCPGTQAPTPGLNGCTVAYPTFAALISALETDAGTTYSGNGTIYVADSYDGNDGTQIQIDGTRLSQFQSNDLTISGGWDDGSGTAGTPGVSEIDVSVTINNWLGNILIQNLVIANTTDSTGFGLHVDTTGTVELNNVTASGSTSSNDGAMLTGNAGVRVENSDFSSNGAFGLMAWSSAGNIVIDNITATGNTQSGVYLDTCKAVNGVCTSTGDVTVNGGTITGNQLNGLHVSSGGSTVVNTVNASNNSLTGLLLLSGTESQANAITIHDGTYSNNTGGAGIRVYQYGDGLVTLESGIVSDSNRYGGIIYNYGAGDTYITQSVFSNSTYTGLHVESTGTINIDTIDANLNGSNGAYLLSDAGIIVVGSNFNDNVKINSPADPGLFAKANGNIILQAVTANGNVFGPGAILKTTGTGNIQVGLNSEFNNNGTFGLQATVTDGDMTLNNLTANLNAVKGAYLNATGTGNIDVFGGTFNQNGSYGMYATSSEGNININNATFDGNDTGAKLISSNGGDINLTSTNFQNNEIGAYLVGEANISLENVTATDNNAYGVKLLSTFTQQGCYCAGDENTSIIATIEDGTFQGSEVGIYARPGDEGSVTFTGTQTYANNVEDYVLNTDPIPECDDCDCVKEEKESKSYNTIEVPFSGSGNVPQQCDIYAGTVLEMENGVIVKVRCPFEGFSNLQGLNFSDLPGILDEDMFELGILLGLLGEDGSFILNSDGTITLTFTIPDNTRGRAHQLLFWDTEMNEGQGGWVEMPPFEHGTSFMLHPDDPEDPRMIVSGVVNNGNSLSITVNFAGYFVVVGQ